MRTGISQLFTVWGADVCDVGVVGGSASPKIDARGTAKSDGAEVPLEGESLVNQVALEEGLISEGVKVNILIIGEDEDDVRSRPCLFRARRQLDLGRITCQIGYRS